MERHKILYGKNIFFKGKVYLRDGDTLRLFLGNVFLCLGGGLAMILMIL